MIKNMKDIVDIATECVKHPKNNAVWSPELGRYVQPESEEIQEAEVDYGSTSHPPLAPIFKYIFLTAAGGTLFFVSLCILLTMTAGKEPPELTERLVIALMDLAKIGFGAIAGMLGGIQLQQVSRRTVRS